MKSLKLLTAGIILFIFSSAQAQVSVNINIGTPPSWGPAGYAEVDYYYLPDIQAYYDIRASQFIYFVSGNWIRSRFLPRQYRNYDLYNGYKVVLNGYYGGRPYVNFNNHKKIYYVGYRGGYQRPISPRHNDNRYAESHRYSHDNRYHDNHRGYDNYRGNKYYKHNGHGNH